MYFNVLPRDDVEVVLFSKELWNLPYTAKNCRMKTTKVIYFIGRLRNVLGYDLGLRHTGRKQPKYLIQMVGSRVCLRAMHLL